MSLHTTAGHARRATLNHGVVWSCAWRHDECAFLTCNAAIEVDLWCLAGIVGCRIPVVDLLLAIEKCAEETHTQAKIQAQVLRYVEIILNVWFKHFVANVILGLRAVLRIAGDVSHQEIGESVTGRDRRGSVKREIAFDVNVCPLVFLRRDKVAAELQIVFADVLGDVVAKCVGRVGILPGKSSGAFAEAATVGSVRRNTDIRQLAAKIREQPGHAKVAGALPNLGVGIDLLDVIGGIAGDKLVQQRWRDSRGQPGKNAHSRTQEVRSNRGKALAAPGDGGIRRVPGIVNISKRRPQFRIDVVVDAHQFFPPTRGLANCCGEDGIRPRSGCRFGNHGQQSLSVGVDERHLIIRKRVSGVRVERTVCGLRNIAHVIEISLTVLQRRNKIEEILRNVLPAPILRPEKEGVILPNWPAQRITEVI